MHLDMSNIPLLQIKNISIQIDNRTIIEDFNLELFEKDKIAIKAPSGRGKTSILNAILGFIPIYKGEIILSGTKLAAQSIEYFRNNIAWLPQMFDTDITVSDFIKTPFQYKSNKHLNFDRGKLDKLFLAFDLEKSVEAKKINEISGGEKQRVGIITALMLEKKILIFDEPVSAIDSNLKTKVIDYLFHENELTILSCSHDEMWLNNCNKIIEI